MFRLLFVNLQLQLMEHASTAGWKAAVYHKVGTQAVVVIDIGIKEATPPQYCQPAMPFQNTMPCGYHTRPKLLGTPVGKSLIRDDRNKMAASFNVLRVARIIPNSF